MVEIAPGVEPIDGKADADAESDTGTDSDAFE